MTLGAYRQTQHFAYPGWRLTVPGGPAGGHYKGFTHTQAAGTDIEPTDQYEQDREDGMSSHDAAHANQRNPRGVYRSPAEVPPRPNASGGAHTYQGFQTERHPGTSISPGSFPADFFETLEDALLSGVDLGLMPFQVDGAAYSRSPNTVSYRMPPTLQRPPIRIAVESPINAPTPTPLPGPVTPAPVHALPFPWPQPQPPPQSYVPAQSSTGATSVVAQPLPSPAPLPPAPSVSVVAAPPVSPTPAPIVATNQVVPLNNGSGNLLNVSTGDIVSPSDVSQNPATGELFQTSAATGVGSSAMSWLEQNTIFSALPNWGVLAGGLLLASFAFRGKR